MPMDIGQEQQASQASAEKAAALEWLTKDPRFDVVKDKVPLVSSWGLKEIKPRPGLIHAASVQRTAQIYSPYYSPEEGIPRYSMTLDNMGIGLEDKLDSVPPEGMAVFFANEAGMLRQGLSMKFHSLADSIDTLVDTGEIQNSGSEYGRVQLLMLAELDLGIASMVERLNKSMGRERGNAAFDYRQQIYDFLKSSGIPEERLIAYSNGERFLAIPREGDKTPIKYQTGMHDLNEELAKLGKQDPKKLRDWKFLRSAVFMLSDPRVREVLEAYRELKVHEASIAGSLDNLPSEQYHERLRDAIRAVSAKRIRLHPKPKNTKGN